MEYNKYIVDDSIDNSYIEPHMRPDIGPDPAKPSTGGIIGIIFLLLLLLIYVIGI